MKNLTEDFETAVENAERSWYDMDIYNVRSPMSNTYDTFGREYHIRGKFPIKPLLDVVEKHGYQIEDFDVDTETGRVCIFVVQPEVDELFVP